MAVVDWDHDGDLDLWLANRTAPRLRLMRNNLTATDAATSFVAVRLRGMSCNRDAIGARVEVVLKDRSRGPLIQSLYAGDGFLSQSSKWLHFGLERNAEINHVIVRWPGGDAQAFDNIHPGQRYLLVQGSHAAQAWSISRQVSLLAASPQTALQSSDVARVYLPTRLPMPLLRYRNFDDTNDRLLKSDGRALLLNFWATWCVPCLHELKELAAGERQLRKAGLSILSLSVDGLDKQHPTTPSDAADVLAQLKFPFGKGLATPEMLEKIQIIQDYLFNEVPPFVVPVSFLFDREGRLAVIYRGRVNTDVLLDDVAKLDVSIEQMRSRAVPFDGRWHERPMSEDLKWIAARFQHRYPKDAARYWERALAQRKAQMERGVERAGDEREIETELFDLHLQLGTTYYSDGRTDEAIEHLQRAVELKPQHIDARQLLDDLIAARSTNQ